MLKYNIDFEIMGMLVTIVIGVAFRMNYISRTRSDKAFMKLVYCILAAQALDMLTAITFSFEAPALNLINLIMTTGYFYFAFATAVCFERYVNTYLPEKNTNKIYEYTRIGIIIVYVIHGLLNPFTKLAFYFEPDGTYVHGDLYILGYVAPALFAVASLYKMIRHHKNFAKKHLISSIFFLFMVFLAMVLQFFIFTDVYLTFGLVPIALLVVLFSLETPDYRKLISTLDELELAREEAMRANRVKSDFLANMSHEIRTPINAVLGFDEMILRESSEKEILGYAANIKNSGQTLLTLINDILDFSKIEAGKMEILNAEYDTLTALLGLVKMITPRAAEKGLKLTCDIDEGLPRRLIGDDVRISQVLTNLLTNAVKYTQSGEVTLKLSTVKENGDTATILFEVIDTGMGIKPEDKEKLFAEFGRVEGRDTHRIEGTGLGLPITMKCLQLMGSRLEVDSIYGEGSNFHFLLDQKISDPEPIGDFEKARRDDNINVEVFREDFTAPDAHILVTDDVDLNLKVFKGLLKRSQMHIDTASSGAEAIKMIAAKKYDLIFMDHQMPEMDGIETLELLKKKYSGQIENIPVIALTANAISGARDMYLQKGFSDYLSKPVDGWALMGMLHRWLPKEMIHEITDNDDVNVMEFAPADSNKAGMPDGTMERLAAAGLDTSAGLMYAAGDESFYMELLGDFCGSAPGISGELNRYYAENDQENYRTRVHALKSTAKTIGAMKLSEEAKALEAAAKEGDESFIEKNHTEFLDHYKELCEKIKM